jgi:hypothetical protein
MSSPVEGQGQNLARFGRGHTIGRVSQILPPNLHCDECEAILRELLDARQVDVEEMREHLFEAARSTGREPEEMRDVWLSSVMRMPDDEMQTVMRAHARRATEARRRKKSDHEIATGHSVDQLVSMVLLGYRQRPLPDSK